ncbi:plasmolipin isoform X5 [Rhinatrema bivittatum]|uniref:plasmolipin isoform X5 n=1 Tax=Rhinatrema bivittatum TaxID=194408 RepID=UPI00112B2E07|nr:plasmolipin isoform X5 [Rhinatrema bivittatum]
MAEFPSKVSTQTSSPETAAGAGRTFSLRAPACDVAFLRSWLGVLMVLEIVLGLLVWALIADSHYYNWGAYHWVMFVAVFCWLLTIIFLVIYLLQLHLKLHVIPWAIVLLMFNLGATILYIIAFITCAASVSVTSEKYSQPYNKRAAASFFACLVMIAYGVSTFFSFMGWRGLGSNAATSQAHGA